MNKIMTHKRLEELFGGNLNQSSFREAADFMAHHTIINHELHNEFIALFEIARQMVALKDEAIIDIVNSSGYTVKDFDMAQRVICHFEVAYKEQFLRLSVKTD